MQEWIQDANDEMFVTIEPELVKDDDGFSLADDYDVDEYLDNIDAEIDEFDF
jgi:hypothetical protein